MFTFQKGSTIVIRSGSASREFLASSISASQTFLEQSRDARTIHSPNTLSHVGAVAKSNTSISFEVYIGNVLDGIIFSWAGFAFNNISKFNILPTANQAIPYSVDIKSNGTNYSISNVYLENISIGMSKDAPLTLRVTAVGGNLIVGSTVLPAGSKQNAAEFILGPLSSSNLAGITCEITRDITWLNQLSVHSALSGSMYVSDTAVCSSLAVAGTITQYKKTNSQLDTYNTNQAIEFIYAEKFKVSLDKCNAFSRYEMADVHKLLVDYKLQATTTNSYLEFI